MKKSSHMISLKFPKLDNSTDCGQAEIKSSKIPEIIFCLSYSSPSKSNCKKN